MQIKKKLNNSNKLYIIFFSFVLFIIIIFSTSLNASSFKISIKSFKFGLICSIGSIIGAIIGYGIGYFLWWSSPGSFTSLANLFFDIIPGFSTDVFYSIKDQYEEWNFWIVFTAGFTPIPFKIFTISAGAFDINFPLFVFASALSRSARFFLVAGLIWKFGQPISNFIFKYFNLLTILFMILLIGGFFIIKVFL